MEAPDAVIDYKVEVIQSDNHISGTVHSVHGRQRLVDALNTDEPDFEVFDAMLEARNGGDAIYQASLRVLKQSVLIAIPQEMTDQRC